MELKAQDLKAFQAATFARAKRASLNEKITQKGEVIKVSECQAISSKRKEKEEEQA